MPVFFFFVRFILAVSMTLNITSSVECFFGNPDCSFMRTFLFWAQSVNRAIMMRSMSLPRQLSRLLGLYEDGLSGSFFAFGMTMILAIFHDVGV